MFVGKKGYILAIYGCIEIADNKGLFAILFY